MFDDCEYKHFSLAVKFYLLYINFMSTRENNVIGFVRDLPRLPGSRQVAMLEPVAGRLVIEGRRVGLKVATFVEDWDHLLKIVRPGNVVAVARTRVVVPSEVWRFQRQLVEAFEAVESIGTKQKPVTIWDVENDWHSDNRAQRGMMWASATEDFQRVARYDATGRPPMNWTEKERAVIDAHWFNVRRHETNTLAAAAICRDAKRLGLPRLAKVKAYHLNGHFGASGRGLVRRKNRE